MPVHVPETSTVQGEMSSLLVPKHQRFLHVVQLASGPRAVHIRSVASLLHLAIVDHHHQPSNALLLLASAIAAIDQ